ncbi:hypothetical protein [Zoogloea sp.]|jgi:hypothetical protein|uniref:hypothetical protein n=1 Tax=Zoogloea sp. TaxID=49181 RepID=UPI0037D9DC54
MIVNNYGSNISTQNNIEISTSSAAAVSLFQQMVSELDSDPNLSPAARSSAQAVVTEATRSINEGSATRETVLKSLGALAGIGSIAGLVSKVIDVFYAR